MKSVEYLRFGVFDMLSQFANQISTQVDKMIIGGALGAHALGIYTIAWELIVLPFSYINRIINNTAYPIFSSIKKESQRIGKYYLEIMSVLIPLHAFIYLLIGILGPTLVYYFYGANWSEAGIIVSILAIAGWIKAVANPGSNIIMANGRTDVGLLLEFVLEYSNWPIDLLIY